MNEKEQLKLKIAELERKIDSLNSSTTISYEVDTAFRERFKDLSDLPIGFQSIPLTQISSPSGGATVDGPARSAIDEIITTLEVLGLISPN
jgi:hypothetical protein